MKTLFKFGTILIVGLMGCTTAQFVPAKMNEVYAARTSPEAVELFRSAAPTKKFIEIGAVSACCSVDANDMIVLLRKKASEAGGDALSGLDLTANGRATASVIRYDEKDR